MPASSFQTCFIQTLDMQRYVSFSASRDFPPTLPHAQAVTNHDNKVGGLPLAELNHLELQFLLLNDFRLSVPVEELEAYGTMLVEFYAREVIVQRQGSMPADMVYPEDEVMKGPASP